MTETIFTISADFNSPPEADGTRTDIVFSKWIVDSYKDGHYADSIAPGKPIIVYFDPEGDKYPYEAGWSVMGTILDVEVRPSKYTPNEGDLLWIHYQENAA